jgi:catechol 2,3-dioxygenase-like lactoylglutathione lyase family enzyme
MDEAIRFWTGALGFELERQAEMGGAFLHQVTGIDDPSVKTAIVRASGGYVVELLQYSKGRQNGAVPDGAGAIGAAHLALTVSDIHAVIARIEAAGWKQRVVRCRSGVGQGRERWSPTFQGQTISR